VLIAQISTAQAN